MKTFEVNIDMVWSFRKTVKAKNKAEAKRKAWERFKKHIPKKDFSIDAELHYPL